MLSLKHPQWEFPRSSNWKHLYNLTETIRQSVFQTIQSALPSLSCDESSAIHDLSATSDNGLVGVVTDTENAPTDTEGIEDNLSKDAAKVWYTVAGSRLQIMLEEAGYPYQEKVKAMQFFAEHVVRSLGPPPVTSGPTWKSPMTDDFSPIEYSWLWTPQPRIRYSVEMIGQNAGKRVDPFNQNETLAVIEKLKIREPHMNWSLFESLLSRMSVNRADTEQNHHISVSEAADSDPASLFLAFEPWKGKTEAKAYLLPPGSMFHNSLDLFRDLIETLRLTGLATEAYDNFLDFLTPGSNKPSVACQWLAIDCVEPEESRLKFYVRSKSTSFETVRQVLSLNDTTDTLWTASMISELKMLWWLVLSLPEDFSETDELAHKEHETSGILFYFDVNPKHSAPQAKVYIPVKHYGRNDQAALDGLVKYLESCGTGELTSNFRRVMDTLGAHRSLESRCGIQTYISCAVKDDRLSLTSYLSPEFYQSFEN